MAISSAPAGTASWLGRIDAQGLDAPALRDRLRTVMQSCTAALITGAACGAAPLAFWDQVGTAVGTRYTGGQDASGAPISDEPYWFDVRYEPSQQHSFRHANAPQPLHSDGAYVADPPDYTFFYMARQADEGGESLLADARTIAQAASADDPAFFHALFHVPVHMAVPPNPGQTTPILFHEDGSLRIAWNWYRIVEGQSDEVVALTARFRDFLETFARTPAVARFRLERGDALMFDDRSTLHGRAAFSANATGDRLIWKTYFRR